MAFTKRGAILRALAVAAVAGLLLSRLGPFDTFSDLPAFERTAYWTGLTLLLAAQILVACDVLAPVFRNRHWSVPAALSSLLGAVPSAFEVAWAESLLRVERDLGLVDLLFIYGDVLLVAVPLAFAMRAVIGSAAPAATTPLPGDPSRLMAALPPARRGALLAFKAEDHYLRVYTANGEALVLRRFGDALAEVAGLDGAQVHRGWWVARGAIADVMRSGDRSSLILSNGVTVPVSRTYVLAAREAGLLPG